VSVVALPVVVDESCTGRFDGYDIIIVPLSSLSRTIFLSISRCAFFGVSRHIWDILGCLLQIPADSSLSPAQPQNSTRTTNYDTKYQLQFMVYYVSLILGLLLKKQLLHIAD
jgi:hypothetical protein